MRVTDLRCSYLTNPVGIGGDTPRLSWKLEGERRGLRQTAYQIRVARSADALQTAPDLWDSGRVDGAQSVGVLYEGTPLASMQRAFWTVTIWDEQGTQETAQPAFWETGLLERADWTGQWIGGGIAGGPQTSVPAPFLRRVFAPTKRIKSARLYATALGLYECFLNGQRVGDWELTPGWTDYNTRVQYQAYDVTGLVQSGANVWGAILGDGWYCGCVEWRGRQRYGDIPQFLAQLVLTYDDGTTETIATGPEWKLGYGPILATDLLQGETQDARRALPGDDAHAPHWHTRPDLDETGWQNALVFSAPNIELSPMVGPPMRATQELKPIGSPVSSVFDFGQNLVGRVRLTVKGPAGATLRLRFAEVLKDGPNAELPGGGIYTDNLRAAQQTDVYTLSGAPDGETFEPRFTFHGFRYVEVTKHPAGPDVEPLTVDSLTAVVLHSDTPQTGTWECSDPLLNQLQKNIDWGQRGNYVDIPTDCPQRDERLGWTGDAQAFVRTAAFNRDIAGFFAKWLRDARDSQGPDGQIPPVIPDTGVVGGDGGPAWADAAVICPWTIYRCYGDPQILIDNYDMMARFVGYLENTARDFIRVYDGYPSFAGFGDWLALDGSGRTEGGTPKELIGTAFLAYDAQLMAQIADVLSKKEDAARYRELFANVRDAFRSRYVTPTGLVYPGTQTAHVLALHFGLLDPEQIPGALHALVRDIEKRGNKLATGFVGSPYLPHVLTVNGRADVAFKLLKQTGWPSYLYAVTQGATTIWERWDGWTKEKGFQDKGMNSFNHYAYGAIGDWMYQVVAGIDLSSDAPGYQNITLRPHIGGDLTHVRARLETVYGPIESAWQTGDNGGLTWSVTVPPNTTAIAHLPAPDGANITESDSLIEAVAGITAQNRDGDAAVFTLQPGAYQFQVGA